MSPFTKYIKDKVSNTELVGVEVGVRDGLNAFYLLQGLPINRLYLVDPFIPYDDYGRKFWTEDDKWICWKALFKVADTKDAFPKTMLIHQTSERAREVFGELEMKFDFVYIDADHKYECVKDDLNWWELVRPGGVMGGHDYGTVDGEGVLKAVDEFVKERGVYLDALENSRGGREWAILKR